MKAALLYGAHDFRIQEIAEPEINKDQYLVNVEICGVCHSEIHQWESKIENLEYPRHIGHEVSGTIIKKGKNTTRFDVGDRVAVWTEGKGFAEKVAVKEHMLQAIGKEISFKEALSEPIACTSNAIMRSNIQMGDTVALVGTGFMGLILLQQIKLCGANVIAVDIRNDMLDFAKSLGADIVINPSETNIKQKINEITDDQGVDISFEAGGVQSTLDLAAELLRMEGKLVIFGYHPGERIVKDLGYWNWMAFDIINAHFRDINTILNGANLGMKLLNTKKITTLPLITHQFKLDEIEEAFSVAKMKPNGFIKAVIKM